VEGELPHTVVGWVLVSLFPLGRLTRFWPQPITQNVCADMYEHLIQTRTQGTYSMERTLLDRFRRQHQKLVTLSASVFCAQNASIASPESVFNSHGVGSIGKDLRIQRVTTTMECLLPPLLSDDGLLPPFLCNPPPNLRHLYRLVLN